MRNKPKIRQPRPNDVKAAIIRKHGTLVAFATAQGLNLATVYAAVKNRRNGPTSVRIRELALR